MTAEIIEFNKKPNIELNQDKENLETHRDWAIRLAGYCNTFLEDKENLLKSNRILKGFLFFSLIMNLLLFGSMGYLLFK